MAFTVSSVVAAEQGWRPLFNGKDLAGWETYMNQPLATSEVPGAKRDEKGNYTELLGVNNDPLKCFTVVEVDGAPAIRLSGEGFGTLTTREAFSNFHLRCQVKWGRKKWLPGTENRPRATGVLYHGYGNHGDADALKRWLHAHQFQIQEGNTGEYVAVGNVAASICARKSGEKKYVYDPTAPALDFSGKQQSPLRCGGSGNFEKPSSEWDTLELICVGDEAWHIVNGRPVLRLTRSRKAGGDPGEPLSSGKIQLQMEGFEAFFRSIEIKPVKEVPAEFAAR